MNKYYERVKHLPTKSCKDKDSSDSSDSNQDSDDDDLDESEDDNCEEVVKQ